MRLLRAAHMTPGPVQNLAPAYRLWNQLHDPLWGFPDFKAIYRFIFQAGSPDCSEPITAECNFLALMEKICEVSGKGWK